MAREVRVIGSAPAIALAGRLDTLEDVLRAGFAQGWELLEVVVQDEYTHDVVVRGPAPAYLVFDTT